MTTIHLTRFDTPMGAMSLASSEQGIVACSLPGDGKAAEVERFVSARLPEADIVEGTGRNAEAVAAVCDYLRGSRRDLDLPVDLRGTPFQTSVWKALRKLRYGETISYAELARRVGRPTAVRAAGAANGRNPVPLFVPCHRVVASDGSLGGFGGGLPLKQRLLELEGSR